MTWLTTKSLKKEKQEEKKIMFEMS